MKYIGAKADIFKMAAVAAMFLMLPAHWREPFCKTFNEITHVNKS